MKTTELEKLRHELFVANSELDSIRAVFEHGADEENWKPGTTLAEAVAKLKETVDKAKTPKPNEL